MTDTWGSTSHATRLRRYIRQMVLSVLNEERPEPRFAIVKELESVGSMGRCKVMYVNDDEVVTVKTYGVKPMAVDQRVIVDGPRRMRYVTQVFDAPQEIEPP